MGRNPLAKNYAVLGITSARWAALKTAVTAILTANEALEEIPDVTLRAAGPELAADRVWNELKKELGIT